ncbi:hypothetical protein LTR17_018255 [Elasticomyces elasticus]|nr:hypothetical protein LTR17_018255 [Elasticomyces elasticus]
MDALPQELIDHIGGECDKASLLSLRLVNKKLAAALRTTFIERYISKRTHLYSIYGMQKLIDLTADRDLAKHIKEIVFVVQDLYLDYNPDHTLTEGYEYQLCTAETEWFDRTGCGGSRAKSLLQDMLWNLEQAASSVTLAFCNSYYSSRHPYGLETRKQQASIAGLARPNVEPYSKAGSGCDTIIKALLEASVGQSASIWQLDICHTNSHLLSNGFPSAFEGFEVALTTPTWFMLRSLKLSVQYGLGLWNEEACWDGFDRFLSAAPHLESLSLAFSCSAETGHSINNSFFALLGDSLSKTSVKHLELGPFLTTRKALIGFLDAQMGSLESVKLVPLNSVRVRERWRRVPKAVAERTTMAKTELSQMLVMPSEEEHDYMVMDMNGNQHIVQGRQEAVNKRLVELADRHSFID